MRKIFYFVVCMLLITGCVKKQYNPGNSTDPSGKLESGKSTLIIDVRTPEEYSSGHIDGAINIPLNVIANEIGNYTKDKSRKIFLYCRTGSRSGQALEILKNLGYTNAENIGGYEQARARLK
jgi:phage shock protein E